MKTLGNRVKYRRKEEILENRNKKDAEKPDIKAIVLLHNPQSFHPPGLTTSKYGIRLIRYG